MKNINRRVERILTALNRGDTSRGDGHDRSNGRLRPDSSGTVHLPRDATVAERTFFEQMRGMLSSILPPSYVTSELYVED